MLSARILTLMTLEEVLVSTAHTVPPLCCFSLNEPSRLDSGASPSLASLAAAQGRHSLIICVACSIYASFIQSILSIQNITRQAFKVTIQSACTKQPTYIYGSVASRTRAHASTALQTTLLINEHYAAAVASVVMDDVAPALNPGWVRRRESSCRAVRGAQR